MVVGIAVGGVPREHATGKTTTVVAEGFCCLRYDGMQAGYRRRVDELRVRARVVLNGISRHSSKV